METSTKYVNKEDFPSISSLKSALYKFAGKNYELAFWAKLSIVFIALFYILAPIWYEQFF